MLVCALPEDEDYPILWRHCMPWCEFLREIGADEKDLSIDSPSSSSNMPCDTKED